MNSTAKILVLGSILTGISLFNSCKKEDPGPQNPPPNPPADVRYNSDISDIVANYCLTCHGDVSPSAGLSLTTYASVKDATQNGTLLNRINNASAPMPQSGLMSAQNRQKFQDWADGGYLEN